MFIQVMRVSMHACMFCAYLYERSFKSIAVSRRRPRRLESRAGKGPEYQSDLRKLLKFLEPQAGFKPEVKKHLYT